MRGLGSEGVEVGGGVGVCVGGLSRREFKSYHFAGCGCGETCRTPSCTPFTASTFASTSPWCTSFFFATSTSSSYLDRPCRQVAHPSQEKIFYCSLIALCSPSFNYFPLLLPSFNPSFLGCTAGETVITITSDPVSDSLLALQSPASEQDILSKIVILDFIHLQQLTLKRELFQALTCCAYESVFEACPCLVFAFV